MNKARGKSFLKICMLSLVLLLNLSGFQDVFFAAEDDSAAGQTTAGQTAPGATGTGTGAAVPSDGQNAQPEIVKEPSLSAVKLKIISSEKKELLLNDCTEAPVWNSSNNKVAEIRRTSNPCRVWIKAKKAGRSTITAKVGSKKYRCKVTVKYRPRLSLNKKTLKGDSASVTLKVSGTVDQAMWSSTDPDVASVSRKKGRKTIVKAIRNGKVTIYAKVNGKSLACAIRVKGITPTVNYIAGSKSTGYYYVDKTGSRVYDDEIKAALDFLNSVSSPVQTPRARMLACFRRLCTYTYSWHPDTPSAWVMPRYAADTFRTKIANCWRFGAAFAYIARVLGYDTRVCIGGVTAYQDHALDNHGWCEIYIDGTWKMVDVSMQKHHPEVSLFLVPRARYPFRLQVNSSHPMTVNGTNVIWS